MMTNPTVRSHFPFLVLDSYKAKSNADYRGNKILLGLCCANIALFLTAKLYYIERNKSKQKSWDLLDEIEKATYLATTKDTGLRKLNVRFAH
jgi:hypothetical protein